MLFGYSDPKTLREWRFIILICLFTMSKIDQVSRQFSKASKGINTLRKKEENTIIVCRL
jgi:hypothetical protein